MVLHTALGLLQPWKLHVFTFMLSLSNHIYFDSQTWYPLFRLSSGKQEDQFAPGLLVLWCLLRCSVPCSRTWLLDQDGKKTNKKRQVRDYVCWGYVCAELWEEQSLNWCFFLCHSSAMGHYELRSSKVHSKVSSGSSVCWLRSSSAWSWFYNSKCWKQLFTATPGHGCSSLLQGAGLLCGNFSRM